MLRSDQFRAEALPLTTFSVCYWTVYQQATPPFIIKLECDWWILGHGGLILVVAGTAWEGLNVVVTLNRELFVLQCLLTSPLGYTLHANNFLFSRDAQKILIRVRKCLGTSCYLVPLPILITSPLDHK